MTERALAINTDQGLAALGLFLMLIVTRSANLEDSRNSPASWPDEPSTALP